MRIVTKITLLELLGAVILREFQLIRRPSTGRYLTHVFRKLFLSIRPSSNASYKLGHFRSKKGEHDNSGNDLACVSARPHTYWSIAVSNSLTACCTSSAPSIALMTAMPSVPARMTCPAFAWLIPPIARMGQVGNACLMT